MQGCLARLSMRTCEGNREPGSMPCLRWPAAAGAKAGAGGAQAAGRCLTAPGRSWSRSWSWPRPCRIAPRPELALSAADGSAREGGCGMSELVDKLFAIHDSLAGQLPPHAFGGAIALAYCVRSRAGLAISTSTSSSMPAKAARSCCAAGRGAGWRRGHRQGRAGRPGPARLGRTPMDVFLNNMPLHEAVAIGVVWVQLAGHAKCRCSIAPRW